ncbi:MAG: A/G-specific adenine glycosylase [Methylophilaceae bacterium]|jgi:A/G-specific adenine glycosylase
MRAFSTAIIAWQKDHGRHVLPWQNTTNPYAIWVSEIMLQQTQVTAVIGYYANFMVRFPVITDLANATQEEVLQSWSGLGYYSRARNLHNAAQTIVDDFNGVFPTNFDDIISLSGIGRSTAAAISTFALDRPQPILDGNVKRVFARHFLVEGWTGKAAIQKQLWTIAEQENPPEDAIAYTQGLMDLGSLICTRSKPKCELCPVNNSCKALANDQTKNLPTPKLKKTIPHKETTMLVIRMGNEVLLEKRPQKGIWAGLWSLPEISMTEIGSEVAHERFGLTVDSDEPLTVVNHVFTHYKLDITPQPLLVTSAPKQKEKTGYIWMVVKDAIGAALPTPVRNILLSIS